MRHDRLSKREREVLEYLNTDEGDGDLICARPGGWWFGTEHVAGRIGFSLVRKVLISPSWDEGRGSSTYYRINEEGQKALAADVYEPEIFTHIPELRFAFALPADQRRPQHTRRRERRRRKR